MLLQSEFFDKFVSAITRGRGLRAECRIAVCGTHRSGTTLLGDLLSADPGSAQIFEPFNPQTGIDAVGKWYASADRPDSPWRRVIDRLLAGRETKWRVPPSDSRSLRRWLKGTRVLRQYVAARVLRPRRIVLKDPLLTLSAQYLIEQYDFRVLFTIKHPCVLLASLRRVDWDVTECLDDLVEQGSCSREMRSMATTQAAEVGLFWLVVNRHALETIQRFPGAAVILSHEEFCRDPHAEMARVTQSLGIVYSDTMRSEVSRATGGDVVIPPAGEIEHLVRNSAAMVGEWRDRVSARDEAELRRVCEPLYQRLVGTDWLGRAIQAAESYRDTVRVAASG